MTSSDHYTYRLAWSPEDDEYVASCLELPSLSWLDRDPGRALTGLREVVNSEVADMAAAGEPVPEPLGERSYSGKFNVRIPGPLHRELVMAAAEQGISLNRLVSDRLARALGP